MNLVCSTSWQKINESTTDFEKNEGAKVTKPHSLGVITDIAVKLGGIVQNDIPYRLV
jgi:hypothetical protein